MITFEEFNRINEETELFDTISSIFGDDAMDGVSLVGKGLRFVHLKMGSNANRVGWIRITLKHNKNYTVETIKMKNITPTVIKKIDNVPEGKLKETFMSLIGRWTFGDWMEEK